MKKLIVIFLCIAMIIGIGIGVYELTKETHLGIDSILPQNVSFYVQWNDVEKNFKELKSMPIWQGISNIDYDLLMKKNAIEGQQAMFINLIKNQLSDVINNPLAKKFFGHDVAVAIYPLNKDIALLAQEFKILNPKFIEELLSGLFLVTRVDSDVQFAEFVSRFFSQFGSNISQGQVEYKGEVIHTISITNIGVKFGIVRLNDLLVIGIGDKAARVSIDVFKGDEPSLAEDSRFSKIQNRFLKPSSMVGYFNFSEFMELFKQQGDKLVSLGEETTEGAELQIQWEKALEKINSLQAIALSSQLTPIIRVDSRLIFDLDRMDADYIPIHTCPPGENKTIDFTPKDVLGYYWGNCFKLDYYWEQLVKEMERTEVPASRIDEFQTAMGLSVKGDILPAFGEEFGLYIQDIQVGGLFPIPKVLFFVEVGKKSKMEKLLAKLEEQPFVMFQEENYNDALIKYLALPMGEDIQPGYTFLGKYFLISTSRKLLKNSIDTSQNASLSLQADPDFKEIDFGLTDKNRSVQFVKVGQMVEKSKAIIDWSNQWKATNDRKAQAFKAGSAKPLEEVKASIVLKEKESEEIRDRLILVEDDIWNLESKGLDASVKQAEFDELSNQLDAKKEELVTANERKEELAGIVEELDENSPDPVLRQFYLDEVIYPVLDSLKFIKSFGMRSTVNGDTFESSILIKVTK